MKIERITQSYEIGKPVKHSKSEFDELWIGDSIFLISAKKFARWEGWSKPENLAKIRLEEKVLNWPIHDMEIRESPPAELKPVSTKPHIKASVPFDPSDREIDLHIEKLNPSLTHARPERILEYQISMCHKFLENAINHKSPFVTIVHGKGEGVLKLEVEHLLSKFPEVNFHIPANQGGASEVWMSYK